MTDNIAAVVQVVRVQPGDKFTLGTCKAFVDCVSLAFIGLGDPPGDLASIGITLDDLDTAIGRAAIHDQVFDVGIILPQHRLDGLLDEAGVIEAGGDD